MGKIFRDGPRLEDIRAEGRTLKSARTDERALRKLVAKQTSKTERCQAVGLGHRLAVGIFFLFTFLVCTTIAHATPSPRVIVEIADDTAGLLDARLARRLISLELADVVVPPPEGMTPEAAPLYFRVLVGPSDTFRVELWELGRSRGARSVSTSGSPHLRARRIALAAAELARQVVFRRQADARATDAAAEEAAKRHAEARGFPIHASVAISPGLEVGAVGLGDFWLAGPALGVGLRMSNGFALELKGDVMAGPVNDIDHSGTTRWIGATLSPSYTFLSDAPVGVEAGISATASAVHFSNVLAVDETRSESDTWSARALASVSIVPRISESLRLRIGPDAGFVLRRLVVTDTNGDRHRLGGLWIGLSTSVLLEPWRSEPPSWKTRMH